MMQNTALNSMLLQSVQDNNPDLVVNALQAGADINCTDSDGCTPAILAVQLNDRRIYNYLVAEGADLDVVDSFGHDVKSYDALSLEWLSGVLIGSV